MSDERWYDEVDYTPYLICKCLLSDGSIVDGRFAMGQWESMDGEAIYPTHFKIDRAVVSVHTYNFSP